MKRISIIMLLLASIATTCHADGMLINVNSDTNTVTIRGEFTPEDYGRYVSLRLENPIDAQKDSGGVNRLEQVRVKQDGTYIFSFTMNGESGVYTAKVGLDQIYSDTFEYYTPEEISNVFEKLVIAVNTKDYGYIKWVIDNRSDLLKLDMSYYSALPTYGEINLKDEVVKNLKVPESVAAFTDDFLKTTLTYTMNIKRADQAAYKELFDKVKVGPAFAEANAVYGSLSSKIQTDVIAKLAEKEYSNTDSLLVEYETLCVLTKVNGATLWGDMYDALDISKNILKIDFVDYNKLSKKSVALNKMLAITYGNITDVVEKFKFVVREQAKAEEDEKMSGGNGSSGGSGSGMGSGSGSGHIVSTQPMKVPEQPKTTETTSKFGDMGEYKWALDAVEFLADKDVINGSGDGLFHPGEKVTRAEFVKMVVCAFGISSNDGDLKFTDVALSDWYYPYVKTAFTKGIINGKSDMIFDPNSRIQRQDAAVLLCRASNLINVESVDTLSVFSDANSISEYARKSVDTLNRVGIIKGTDNGMFMPLSDLTRAEAAELLYRMLMKTEGVVE